MDASGSGDPQSTAPLKASARQSVAQRTYAAPFGRFEGPHPSEHPENAMLLGKRRERARMLDWLFSYGSRGSYLVTGYRGTGKTSFVNYCLKVYEEDIYGRWLQSTAGKTIFWDRLLIACAVVFCLSSVLFASQLGVILFCMEDMKPRMGSSWVIHWFLAAPIVLTIGFPLAYGLRVLSVATGSMGRQGWGVLFHWSCITAGLAFALAVAPFSSAPLMPAYFVALLAQSHFTCTALSISMRPASDPGYVDPGFQGPDRSTQRLCAGTVAAEAIALLTHHTPSDMTSALWTYAAIACLSFFLSFSFRAWDDASMTAARMHGAPAGDDSSSAPLGRYHATPAGSAGPSLLAAALALLVFAGCRSQAHIDLLWGGTPFAGVAVVGIYLRRRSWARMGRMDTAPPPRPQMAPSFPKFHPRPRILLVVKGAFLLSLSAQLGASLVAPIRGFWDRTGWSSAWMELLPPHSILSRNALLFSDSTVETHWIGLCAAFCILLMYVENDWIVRRSERARSDDAYDPSLPTTPFEGAENRLELARANYNFMSATFFWVMFRCWLPVLTVRVNLGFDDLSHTQVVTAMLAGLKAEFYKKYISARSQLGLIARALTAMAVFFVAMQIGHPDRKYWRLLDDLKTASRLVNVKISIGEPAAIGSDHLISYLLPYDRDVFAVSVGQFACLVILLAASSLASQRLRLFYYPELLSRITRLLMTLQSTVTTRHDDSGLMRKASEFLPLRNKPSTEVTTSPQDPRTVDQAFLALVRDMVVPHLSLPVAHHFVSLPAPQITFVFDEMDKIGTQAESRTDKFAEGRIHSADRERAARIAGLLSGLKNLLSVAPARFIFVGGREMHDEWLADRTSQQPLLSNIFDAEVYIPTLLVDRLSPPGSGHRIFSNIHGYLNAHLARATHAHRRWSRRKHWMANWLDLVPGPFVRVFVQHPVTRTHREPAGSEAGGQHHLARWHFYDVDADARESANGFTAISWNHELIDALVLYLAFRGRGNPRRTDAILESLVRPTGTVISNQSLRMKRFDCQHVLRLGQRDLFVIQFVSMLFSSLEPRVDVRARHRDDKNLRSAFYLADFLMKFHRRAFGWTSLGKIDELVHVHRAPDLRSVLSDMLEDWSESLLQPILNGMYAFRFRSELAAEIKYLSRLSESEMAGLNFTLDESQKLKQDYRRRFATRDASSPSDWEMHAALGELCDFDEEFDDARRHYGDAVSSLDKVLRDELDVYGAIRRDDRPSGRHATIRNQLGWGVSKLRLILQIAMTYERSRNYERALLEYRAARSAARSLWLAMLDDYGRQLDGDPSASSGAHRLDALKHMHLLYQPLFSAAWVAEKSKSGIDTSLTMVEEGLWEIRSRLPFARLRSTPRPHRSTVRAAHANFSLTMSDLHHGAGNLYFFKGRQDALDVGAYGYIINAHYHYACSLHEVRRSQAYRVAASSSKLNAFSDPDGAAAKGMRVLGVNAWTEFLLRRATASLLGMANAILAMACVDRAAVTNEANKRLQLDGFARSFGLWMTSCDDAQSPGDAAVLDARMQWEGLAGHWLHEEAADEYDDDGNTAQKRGALLRLDVDSVAKRSLDGYFLLASVGADLLEQAGQFEEAAREWLRMASASEAIGEIVLCTARIHGQPPSEVSLALMSGVLSYGLWALENAGRNFGLSGMHLFSHSTLAGGHTAMQHLPLSAYRVAHSMWLMALRSNDRSAIELGKLCSKWRGTTLEEVQLLGEAGRREARGWLRDSLVRNAYPRRTALMSMRTLILDDVLEAQRPGDDVVSMAHDCLQLATEYRAELVFTPYHLGSALGMLASAMASKPTQELPPIADALRWRLSGSSTEVSR